MVDESFTGVIKEYGMHYREIVSGLKKVAPPAGINAEYAPP